MKKFFKFGCLGIIALIIIGIIAAVAGGGDSANNSTESKQKTTNTTSKKDEKKKFTLADYESIKVGDSLSGEGGDKYEDLVAKFGEPSNKTESQTGDIKMIMASWTKNINGDFGANFNVTFMEKDGQKLASSKGQMGMK
ncbi:hypothetical protein [Bacillus paramycoides]|uniref:hypothetical protein n=1 Tax=Bacillus paramycoides TaxID=2026194 RepID=UPI002E1C7507|nr:hypothetical protein [Bacillus paramycoides]